MAGAASAAPIPAPIVLIPVSCGGPALESAISKALPSSVLALTPGCRYSLSRGLPPVSDTLGLQGPATLILQRPGSILTVEAGGNVTTDQISFTGGDATGGPGRGGAIDNNGGTVQVNFGRFSHDNATAYGGAIYNAKGQLKVYGATFIDNSSQQGGAIENFGTASISDANFFANTANGFGGAIENDSATDIHSSTFHGNTAYSGGAAYNKKGTLTILDSGLVGNQTAFNLAAGSKGVINEPTAGAGVSNRARMILAGDRFDGNGNGTTTKGGAVYNSGMTRLTDSTLSNNRALAGGGFYNDGTGRLIRDTVKANSTAHDGGGIYNFGPLTITQTMVRGNHGGLDGGGLLNGASVTIWGSHFYRNVAGIGGGGIHDYYILRLHNTILANNEPDNCESRLGSRGCERSRR